MGSKHSKVLKVNPAVCGQVGHMRDGFKSCIYCEFTVSQSLDIVVGVAAAGNSQKYINFLAGISVNGAGALAVV